MRPIRPLPSRNGWMISNWAWMSANCTSGSISSPRQYVCRLASSFGRRAGSGGTKRAASIGAPGAPVVEDLVDVLAPVFVAGRLPGLEAQHVAQGRLRALDLRGEHRFLRGERGEQHRRIGHAVQDAVVSRERQGRPSDGGHERAPVEIVARQGLRNEGPDGRHDGTSVYTGNLL